MVYRLLISDKASKNIDDIVSYVAVTLSNPEAAKAIINDIDDAYDRLIKSAEIYPFCNDQYLASKGYRKLSLSKHNYVIIYQIVKDVVHISGIFHFREDYAKKL